MACQIGITTDEPDGSVTATIDTSHPNLAFLSGAT